jgi:hypothetical protein
MMTTTHPLADEYLKRLDRAARALPRHERVELVTDVRTHLEAGLPPDATEADVRNLLDELGSPEEIVTAASPERTLVTRGAREVFALLLLVTGFPPVIGWLVGVGLLLWSPLWSSGQKLLAILVWPGGYVVALGIGVVVSPAACTSGGRPVGTPVDCVSAGPSVLTFVVAAIVVLAPLVVAAHLYRAAGRRSADRPPSSLP